ncbi:alkaline phosphatase family protein [Myxococcota bacterium]|nr:alkaline phosphatase family protein [Myxococcota bacterium]
MADRRTPIAAAALAVLALAGCSPEPPDEPGLFVLGVDGMDPVILQRLMDEGKMPNASRLAVEGGFQSLGTANPPQSPVAWSTFVTGRDPGGHGVFDFVHRDPKTYLPISSATPPVEPGEAIELFGWYLPVSGESPVNTRGGTPFWDALHDAGVDVEVYRIPGNYPPTPSDAKVLSGMGTVDMRGGYGVYTWFTDRPVQGAQHLKGDIQLVSVQDDDLDGTPDTVRGSLKGPPDLFHLPPGQIPGDADYLTAPVTFRIDPDRDEVLVEAGGGRALLKEGEWSEWMPLGFDALPAGMMNLEGIVRFYARQVRPHFEVYASPVNVSPAAPAQDVTTPSGFATELYALLGHFYTQGMPEETNALKDRLFDDDDYRRQVALVQEDSGAMIDLALGRFQRGDMTFFYLSDIDLQCHMLWRLGDPKDPSAPPHPAFEPEAAHTHGQDIEGYYRHVDQVLGRVLDRVPEDTLVIVMSDHGFQSQPRTAHLNSWLRDQGYLVLKDGKRTGQIATGDVDWSKTRAYGLGFNGVYLNLAGREAQGIVDPGAADALLGEISSRLQGWADTEKAAPVVRRVFRARDIYSADRVAEAPDLVVGYDAGYGCSDESTLGEVVEATLEDNTSRWSGNHLMDPEVVPGVLLSNKKIPGTGHDLPDVTATLLSHFGVPAPAGMEGRDIFTP